jgi:hypothetical protein
MKWPFLRQLGAKINVRQYTRYLEEVGPPCGPWDKPLGTAQAH